MASRSFPRRSTSRYFGRGRRFVLAAAADRPAPALGEELQLFATWFLGGFLFMSIYLA
jgi:hypothetical protein